MILLFACACTPNSNLTPVSGILATMPARLPESIQPATAAATESIDSPLAETSVETQDASAPLEAAVSIRAVGGNLYIRRGPHVAFNPIGVLYAGDSAHVTGRDVLGDWAQIRLPDQPGVVAWVSLQTRFSVVTGSLSDLPAIEPSDWPEAAYFRNCTLHEVVIHPGESYVPSAAMYPDNEIRLFPGTYTAHDAEVEGEPEVLTFTVREGQLVEAREDGEGNRRKCPIE